MNSPRSENSAVSFEDVTVSFGGVVILGRVTASVPKGSITALIGPNGAGKTMLLMALLGQVAYEGKIRVDAARLGYVPQRLDFDRGLPVTVLDFLVMDRQRRPLFFGIGARHRARAMEALDYVKAAHLALKRLGSLSGGELQRVLLALALSQEPQILIMDEPAAGVDVAGEGLLCEIFARLHKDSPVTQIIVTHDLSMVSAHATDVICLKKTVKAAGPISVLTDEILAATFGLHTSQPGKCVAETWCSHA
ncbi:MAG: metal ABC transporter ATP-binding protein [Deltaproteobacteria bacterium]|nr:metal ABC transporter ATP-binding protein [Deltaproteobacteria bacterium]